MMRLSSCACALSAVLAATLTATAHADTYNFVISTGSTSTTPGTTFVASGTLTGTVDPGNPAALDLASVTGGAQGYSFTGIVPTGSNSNFTYDNLLFTDPNALHVDNQGILLTLNSPIGVSLARVFETNGNYEVDVVDPNDPGDITPFAIDSFTLEPSSSVPEPSTLTLIGTGLLGAFGALRRKLRA
jgi:PEP-CTERM motif